MSTMENSAWLFELLSDHDETLSAGAFDEIVAALDEQSEQVRQLASQRAGLLEALEKIGNASSSESGCYYTNLANIRIARAAIANATQQRNATGGEG